MSLVNWKHDAKLLENPEDTFDSLFIASENRFGNKGYIMNVHLEVILEFERIISEPSG